MSGAAAAPGAGFAETAEFLNVFQNEKVQPTWYEKKLWHFYDCPDYAVNLFNLPTVAYSGEIDRQKQAADVMEKALKHEGMRLVHIIGPKTAHAYHPVAKLEVARRIDAIAAVGRDAVPAKVKFQTYTLRYNRSFWVTIEGMEHQWEQARVEAEIIDNKVILHTKGVTALTLSMRPASAHSIPPSRSKSFSRQIGVPSRTGGLASSPKGSPAPIGRGSRAGKSFRAIKVGKK